MTNLLWPGDHRAGRLLTDAALWQAMLDVENAWLRALAQFSLIPAEAAQCDLAALVEDADRETISLAADSGANPVIPLVALLRQRAPESSRLWIHRGLTSQDVLDSALMLALRDALRQLRGDLRQHIGILGDLSRAHRGTSMVARTLTQPAIPSTFGLKGAIWLGCVCDAAAALSEARTPVQIGGAAGTLAAPTELLALTGDGVGESDVALAMADYTADLLGLERHLPWHTGRAPVTAIGDALVGCTDAWGRIAADIVTLNRPEIGELAEPVAPGRGGSSTMPDKNNPVLSILLRRTALAAAPMAAALHAAAAFTNDDRADGAWHAEWDTLRILGRRTLVAGSHAGDLLAGLRVDTCRMAANLDASDVSGEQRSIAALVQKPPTANYLGATERIIDRALERAGHLLTELQ